VLTLTKCLEETINNKTTLIFSALFKHLKGLTGLEIPISDDSGDWQEITDPISIETNLINKSITHFRGRYNTVLSTSS
jgi:hypothetical protein